MLAGKSSALIKTYASFTHLKWISTLAFVAVDLFETLAAFAILCKSLLNSSELVVIYWIIHQCSAMNKTQTLYRNYVI